MNLLRRMFSLLVFTVLVMLTSSAMASGLAGDVLDCVNAEEFNNIFIPQLQNRINIAREAGIRDENIILDPGVGFAKGLNENKWSILTIKNLKDLGYPVLLGISNKSIIGNISNLPVGERTEGTIALNVLGRTYGSDFFRVHDVRSNKRALEIADAIMNCTK